MKLDTDKLLSHLDKLTIKDQVEQLEQKSNVEYRRNKQKLIIPTALAMSPLSNMKGRVQVHDQLTARYWRATQLTYPKIRELILSTHIQEQVRFIVDSIKLQPRDEIFKGWHQSQWYTGFDDDLPAIQDIIMGAFSQTCQFNCDIRDVGILNNVDMQVEDVAWAKAYEVPKERLNNKLKRFSLQSIAALNYEAVEKYSLAAYVRAYGIGIGLLPATNSLTRVEWTFTIAQPNISHFHTVNQFQVDYHQPLISICTNILAMFGLFHLSKDHTFKPKNSNMNRICTSYINTLRTDANSNYINSMLAHKEIIVRTAPHPFGLAQTYWIARVMGHHGLLTAPLALRLDVTPPPVQKLMIADAARHNWATLPAGMIVDRFFSGGYDAMQAQIEQIKANPPAYSSLHRLYGIPKQSFINIKVAAHVESMLPTIYGYIMNVNKFQNGKRNDIGLAQCLRNMEHDKKWLSNMWVNAWANMLTLSM